jgi:hypothetical protein
MRTSGQCSICESGAEDIHLFLFDCQRSVEVWKELGMHEIVYQVKHIDRSGSFVIEFFICEKDYNTEYIQPVMMLQNSAAKVDQTKNENTNFYVKNPCRKNHKMHGGVSL